MRPNKYDAYRYCARAVDSCTTKEQLRTAYNLYLNFRIMFNDINLNSLLLYYLERKHDKLWIRYGNE